MFTEKQTVRVPDKVEHVFTATEQGLFIEYGTRVFRFKDFDEMVGLFMSIHEVLDEATGYGLLEIQQDREPLEEKEV